MMKKQTQTTLIDVSKITPDMLIYSQEILEFEKNHKGQCKLPGNKSKKGVAYAAMSNNLQNHFDIERAEELLIMAGHTKTAPHQAFRHMIQDGFAKRKLGNGLYAFVYPYEISGKYKMRKGFKYNGSEEEKNKHIELIKKDIQKNYIDIPNEKWQLGHKNPDTDDSSNSNLVLQPPIQGRYRDDYIFLDTLTKSPTPKKFIRDIKNGKSPYTKQQLKDMRDYLLTLDL